MTTPSLAPGTLLATHWIVGGLLGRTEWTELFEAEETGGRVAGLKLFSATLRSQPKTWEWFEGLNTTLARLPAPAIARVYEVGVEQRLSLGFLAAERMSPPNLGRLVTEKGPLSPRTFSRALERIGEALDAVHAERVLHGNLKPQNVFVSPSDPDAARLTDFGCAQLRAGNGIYPALTLGWYAPEIDSGQASPAIDRYALGIVTFFALTGFPWFAALRGQPDGSVKHALVPAVGSASERAKSFGGALHPAFDAWFATALALDPAARFATSTELARAFEKAATEAERAVGAAPTVPDSPPLSATIPMARPVDPAVAALAFTPTPGPTAAFAPVAGSMPPPGASLRPSRTPGPVNRRSVVLFAVLGAALVITTLGVLWGLTRSSDDAEAEAASSASTPAAPSAPPETRAAAPAPQAPSTPAAVAPSPAAPPSSPAKPAPAAAPPAPVAAAPKAAAPTTPAPKAAATAKATATTTPKAAATGTAKASTSVKASTATSTKSSASKTKKKCGTFLKCK